MNKIKLIILIHSMLFFTSCLYIPTQDHGGEEMISEEAMKFFITGKTTRADVLLRFGKPIHRFNEDRYFLYEWETVVGYLIWVLPGYGQLAAGGAGNLNLHYLCLEFTPDNILKSYKHFEKGKLGVLRKNPEKQVFEWMKEKSNQDIDE